ncbi:MAG: hydrogenase expression/formation protein HypE [Planctomyces sp.]|nr:hydrogenase expression/formation protein HypE [Planctomyces sp.]
MFEDRIQLAHGEGGSLSRRLIEDVISPRLGNPLLAPLGDAALLPAPASRLTFTTDAFVVTPLFFPGGSIGRLAVFGTVNDLAVAGARPEWLSLSLILEEGLERSVLERVLDDVAEAARIANVLVVTGDTKVVPRGAADRMFLTTAGIGVLIDPPPPGPAAIQPGDVLIVSSSIGRHGVAILAARESLGFEPPLASDCRSLLPLADALRGAKVMIRAMRDATRGGVAAVLHEWAAASGLSLTVDEARLPIRDDVRGACELLGLDPIHIANEGVLVLATPDEQAPAALAALRSCNAGLEAAVIGRAESERGTPVILHSTLGINRVLDLPSGALLPRIC